jgi:hypothetical protein
MRPPTLNFTARAPNLSTASALTFPTARLARTGNAANAAATADRPRNVRLSMITAPFCRSALLSAEVEFGSAARAMICRKQVASQILGAEP